MTPHEIFNLAVFGTLGVLTVIAVLACLAWLLKIVFLLLCLALVHVLEWFIESQSWLRRSWRRCTRAKS